MMPTLMLEPPGFIGYDLGMAIAISRALHEEMLACAAADPGREVCGLLFGTPNRIEAIRPCTNVSLSPADSFEINPAELIEAHKAERAGGPLMIGCYHSHPTGLTALSDRDRVAYVEHQLWVVIAKGSITAWQPHSVFLSLTD